MSALYENKSNFNSVYETAYALLEAKGHFKECCLYNQSKITVKHTGYDNWNGGTYFYTISIHVPVSLYATIPDEEKINYEKSLADACNEVTKDDENSTFNASLLPQRTTNDIKWDKIDGGKEALKQKVDMLKDIMISVATGTPINTKEVEYNSIISSVQKDCKVLKIPFEFQYKTLWDWYGKWKRDFPTYKERSQYVSKYLSPLYELLCDDVISSINEEVLISITGWDKILRSIDRLKKGIIYAKQEIDFQEIGLICRELLISLAQEVYNPNIHGICDEKGVSIGQTDAVRMLSNYISVCMAGKSFEEFRAYAKNANQLANLLTHKRNATKKDMWLTVSATLSLINFIGIFEDKIDM